MAGTWRQSPINRDFAAMVASWLTPATGQETPQQLVGWAQLYAADGFKRQSIACYEAALAQDPRYFPAQMGLAEILGLDHQYDRSIKMFQELAEEYPGDSKILISLARVLGWSKNYDRSLEVYRQVGEFNPADPVLLNLSFLFFQQDLACILMILQSN